VFSGGGARARRSATWSAAWGQHNAPELPLEDTLDAGWTEKSDI
jgi:hypothetical protein